MTRNAVFYDSGVFDAGAGPITGPGGPPGADGSVWRDGSGAPSNALGVNGDYYLDDATGDVYRKVAGVYSVVGNIKGATGATGSAGAAGAAGAAGSVWRDGSGAPSNSLGVNGDYYLDDATGNVYLKAAGAYSVVGNIKGATGATGPAGSGGVGSPSLVYRYTVTGSDKASIDTGVDTPSAGSNDWTNGDLLEIWVLARTDDAAAASLVDIVLNNDATAIYDRQNVTGTNATASANAGNAENAWRLAAHGSGGSASYAAAMHLTIPGFSGTVFWKTATAMDSTPDATANNQNSTPRTFGYRSTSAITRVKLAAEGTAKLKVGSQLLIYKRLAS